MLFTSYLTPSQLGKVVSGRNTSHQSTSKIVWFTFQVTRYFIMKQNSMGRNKKSINEPKRQKIGRNSWEQSKHVKPFSDFHTEELYWFCIYEYIFLQNKIKSNVSWNVNAVLWPNKATLPLKQINDTHAHSQFKVYWDCCLSAWQNNYCGMLSHSVLQNVDLRFCSHAIQVNISG